MVLDWILFTIVGLLAAAMIVGEWLRKRNTERDIEVPCDFHSQKPAKDVIFDSFGNDLWLCDFCLEVHKAIEKHKKGQ